MGKNIYRKRRANSSDSNGKRITVMGFDCNLNKIISQYLMRGAIKLTQFSDCRSQNRIVIGHSFQNNKFCIENYRTKVPKKQYLTENPNPKTNRILCAKFP